MAYINFFNALHKGMSCAKPNKVYRNAIRDFQSTMKLCSEDGEEAVPKTLSGPIRDSILWAIPADEPDTVKYYPIRPYLTYEPCKEDEKLRPDGSKRTTNMIHHNYLVQGKPVICAGESFASLEGRSLSNKSGHYTPDNECLDYAKCLFEAKGVPIRVLYEKKGGKATRKAKAKKTRRQFARSKAH